MYVLICVLEIKSEYDWVFVMDPDEQITPVNFNISKGKANWCHSDQPSLVSRILEQMLVTATTHKLKRFGIMMNATRDKVTLSKSQACALGFAYSDWAARCQPITGIYLPVHLWIREGNTSDHVIPTIRSIYPGCYADRLKMEARDGQEEFWKSVYQTKYNPPLEGRTLHDNPAKNVFTILAPRDFHGGLSLEFVHQRNHNYWSNSSVKMMMYDRRLVTLSDSYRHCMKNLKAA